MLSTHPKTGFRLVDSDGILRDEAGPGTTQASMAPMAARRG
jgi:hypothetical protein